MNAERSEEQTYYCLWNDNAYSMYLIDVCVVQSIPTDEAISCAMKLVGDGFAMDIEDALFQLRSDALQHL